MSNFFSLGLMVLFLFIVGVGDITQTKCVLYHSTKLYLYPLDFVFFAHLKNLVLISALSFSLSVLTL